MPLSSTVFSFDEQKMMSTNKMPSCSSVVTMTTTSTLTSSSSSSNISRPTIDDEQKAQEQQQTTSIQNGALTIQEQKKENQQVLVRIMAKHEIENLALWNAALDDDSDDDDDDDESDCNNRYYHDDSDCDDEDHDIPQATSTGMIDFCGIIVDIDENQQKNDTSFQIGDVVIGSTATDKCFHLQNQPLHHEFTIITDIDDISQIPMKDTEQQNICPKMILKKYSPTMYRTVWKGFQQSGLLDRLNSKNDSETSWFDDEISMVIVMNEEEQSCNHHDDSTTVLSASIVALELAKILGVTRRVALCASDLDVEAANHHGATDIVRITKKKNTDVKNGNGRQSLVFPPATITIPATAKSATTMTMTTTTLKSWLQYNQGEFDFIFKEEVGRSLWSSSSTNTRQTVTIKHAQCRQLLKSSDDLLLGDTCALIECIWSKNKQKRSSTTVLPSIECYRLYSSDDIFFPRG